MKNSRSGPVGNARAVPSSGEWDELLRTTSLMSALDRAAWAKNRAVQLEDVVRRRSPIALTTPTPKATESLNMEARIRFALAMVSRAA